MVLVQRIEQKLLFLFPLCILLFPKDKTWILCQDKLQCMDFFFVFTLEALQIIIPTPKYSHQII